MSFLLSKRPLDIDEDAQKFLSSDSLSMLERLHSKLDSIPTWSTTSVESALREFAVTEELKLGSIAQPLRAAVTGRKISPGIFEVLAALGKTETLERLSDVATTATKNGN